MCSIKKAQAGFTPVEFSVRSLRRRRRLREKQWKPRKARHDRFIRLELPRLIVAPDWRTRKGIAVNRELAPLVDVMIGNEEDLPTAALGFTVEGLDEHHSKLEVENFRRAIEKVVAEFPNFKIVATTLRNAKTATLNDWGAVCFSNGELYQAPVRENLEIFDRAGGGDSFASGLIYGLLSGHDLQWSVERGAAHGALAMTTPGDTSMATLTDVERVMKRGTARVDR